MPNRFYLIGAGVACGLSGAVAGNALGSVSVLDRSTLAAYHQSHGSLDAASPGRALPDHYPLITRTGIVPVAALSERGLYSQPRYRRFAYAGGPGTAPEIGEPEGDAASSYAGDTYVADQDPSSDQNDEGVTLASAEAAPAPLQLSTGPIGFDRTGQAKRIDVSMTLALR